MQHSAAVRGDTLTNRAATVAARDNIRQLGQARVLARAMDSSFRVPGTPIRFGWDSLLGLIPGVGDAVTALAGGWILHAAHQAGVPKAVLARMVGNIAVDLTLGAVPLVGDLFDIYWKSNIRNVRLLERHLQWAAELTPSQGD